MECTGDPLNPKTPMGPNSPQKGHNRPNWGIKCLKGSREQGLPINLMTSGVFMLGFPELQAAALHGLGCGSSQPAELVPVG